jgi:succinate---hydroxymethylglutarate CoA-transferase
MTDTMILDAIDAFLARDVTPHVHRLEHDDIYPEDIVTRMRELGLFGATIAAEYGGLGLPCATYADIVERIARVWMSLTGIFNSHLIMSAIVERNGTQAQKREFLPRFASAEMRGGLALTEPDCGTDLQAIRCTALRDGDAYVVNGTKTWISNGIHGSCFALLVKTDPSAEPRHRGMSMLLAEKGPGFTVSRKLEKLGYKGIDSAELVFQDYRVPVDRLIGGVEGLGLKHALSGLELGRINVAARGVGVAQAALDESLRYADPTHVWQTDSAASGNSVEARRHGDANPSCTAADSTRRRDVRSRRPLRHGGRHGQAVRHRGCTGERHRSDARAWRLRLFDRVQGGAAVSRCAAAGDRRRHQRTTAHHHRSTARRAEPGVMLPLAGVRILAVEQYGAGPFGSMQLADMGAEVIKIENPKDGGDVSRSVGPYFLGEHDSHFFEAFNRNKRSVTLNLRAPEGQRALHDLAATADAVLDNLRGDQAPRLGVTYDQLKSANPRVVCAHLSAYGREGSRAAWPGYDYLMQAEAGYLSLTGEPDQPPARFGLSIVDMMAGVYAATALLGGIVAARATGVGRDVDVSLFDTALSNLNYLAAWFLNGGHAQGREPRGAHPSLTPSQLYRTADGWIFIMCNKQKFWPVLCEKVERPEWSDDPRFASFKTRLQNRSELTCLLDEALSTRGTASWLQHFAGEVPAAPVHDIAQALRSEFVVGEDRVWSYDHPQGELRMVSPAFRFPGEAMPRQAAPAFGADTDAVLGELGYDAARLAKLREAGVI